jgi:NADH:ubiquinone oxidoreductase subunit E
MKNHFPDEPLRSHTLDMLWQAQDEKGYIANEDITRIASELHISEIELEGVATFYHFFHRKPAGKYRIYINNSILAEFKGLRDIVRAFEKATGASLGEPIPPALSGCTKRPASVCATRSLLPSSTSILLPTSVLPK